MSNLSPLEVMERLELPWETGGNELPKMDRPIDPLPSDVYWKIGEIWLPQPLDEIHIPIDRTQTTIVTPIELSQAILFARRLPMGLYSVLSFDSATIDLIKELRTNFIEYETGDTAEDDNPFAEHSSRAIWRTALHPDRNSHFDLLAVFREEERRTDIKTRFTRAPEGIQIVAENSRVDSPRFAARSLAFYLATELNRRLDELELGK